MSAVLLSPKTLARPASSKGRVEVGGRDRGYGWSPLIGALMHTVNKTYPSVKNEKGLCCGDPTGVSMFLKHFDEKAIGKVKLDEFEAFNSNDPKYTATSVEFGVHKKRKWEVFTDKSF
ncbi:hypothetical protein BBP40_009426 [Aspergillus hancockii]|nr:hypothetical protein BBP40_009426 [Aspergillus hancockii]